MKIRSSDKKWLVIPLKVLMWIVAGMIALVILVVILFQIPPVQNYAAGKAVAFLREKLDTKIELKSIKIGFPKTVNIKGLLVADRNNDTLLYAGNVNVGINMAALISNKLLIRSVALKDVVGKVYRQFPDTSFNYTFIIDAFTGDTTAKVSNDTTGSMIIKLDKVNLENIRMLYSDTLSGIKTGVFIGSLNTSFTNFDLDKQVFKVDNIKLANSEVSYLQTSPLIHTNDTSSAMPPEVGFKNVAVEDFTFSMLNPADGNKLKASIGALNVKADVIDLQKQKFALEKIELAQSSINFEHTKPQHFDTIVEKVIRKEGTEKYVATPEWEFKVKELIVNDNRMGYENRDSLPVERGIDFNHLSITGFNLNTKDLYATPGKITTVLEHLGFNEKSGFSLEEFSSKIHYDTTNITLADLLIKTPNSSIKDHLEVNFNSLTELTENPEKANVNISLLNTVISAKDILYFVPQLSDNKDIKINPTDFVTINGKITGSMEDAGFMDFVLSNNRSTRLAFSGKVRNAMSPANLYAEINGLRINTTKSDIYSYIDPKIIPETVTLPADMNLSGSFTGYLKNFNASVNFNSGFGSILGNVVMNPSSGNQLTRYKAEFKVNNFDLGKLLNQPDTLGPVSLQASLNGIGFNPDSLNAEVKAVVTEAFYNGYTYKNLTAEGFLVNRSYHGEVFIKDDNIDFNYTGYVNFNPDSLAMLFDLQLNGADLKALKLSKDDFKVQGFIHSDLAKRYGPNPLGKLKIYDVKVVRNGFTCPLDSLVVESFYDYDSSVINVRSQFLNANFRGNLVLQSLPSTLMDHLDHYFAFRDTTNTSKKDTTNDIPQNFRFNITMDDPNYICDNLIPELKKYIPLTINGKYNSEDMALSVKAGLPLLDYNGTSVDSLSAEIVSDRQKLNYKFRIGEISNQSFMLQQFAMDGDISDNKIKYNLSAQKTDTFNVLKTSGVFALAGSQYKLIMDEPFILNNTAWRLDPDNVITFSDKGINAQKVILTGQDQMVSIITQPGDNVPLKISFDNFKLMNASIIIEKNEELARGELNGHFILFKVNGVSAFTSDLTIDSLKFRGIPIGNIKLVADNSADPSRFNVNMQLSGYGNQMELTGNYQARDSVGLLDLRANIPHLNMATVQPFTFGQISRMEGFLNGDIRIGGTTLAPDPKGYIRFNDVAFHTSYANTFLKVGNNQLDIANKRINIGELTLTDTINNTAKLTGYADFTNLLSPQFNIRINTDNFLAMNVLKRNENLPVYGTVLLDSDIRLKGTLTTPVVDMSVKLNNGTKLTYVLPEEEMVLNESEGIVVFTDSVGLSSDILKNDTVQPYVSSTQGISVDASIAFEPQAILKILVDPVAGDSLFVTGDGTLNFSMKPGGQMNLTGTYDISSGGYNLTLNNFIKRTFTIDRGSTITWNGDIMDATVDLNAVYKVETSPMILLEDQIEGMEEAARNTYRNELTFLVYLKMKGNLLKPDISFDIQQPDEEKGALEGTVNARLNELRTDESQLNKQVFSLLTLNRFMGQDPFETGSTPLTVESATRASASKLLTQQFSALSEKYIKGVDLDVGVRSFEDYSTGQQQGRTQLKLGVRKELLNDRLMVQVGGNVELEGAEARKNDVSNIAGNINIEYKLTPLGRYRLRGFRRTEYENPIEGEIINTGIGVSYSRDFRGLKQLFTSERKRQERIKAREAKLAEEQQKADDNH